MTPQEPLYPPRSMFSTWIGVVLLFAFFGLLALVVVRASPRGDTYEKKRAKARAEKLEAAQKESLTALTTYGWLDKNKGVARIPITDAMKLTLAELAEKKPTAAGPIAAESPSPAPQTSPATNPAASPTANASATPAASAAPSPAASASTTPKPTSITGPHSESHNQPAAAINPPPAPPGSQPGPGMSPAASPPSAAAKAQVSPSPSASPSAQGTPLPVRGKTP
jgi:hypothetical protein